MLPLSSPTAALDLCGTECVCARRAVARKAEAAKEMTAVLAQLHGQLPLAAAGAVQEDIARAIQELEADLLRAEAPPG